LRGETLIYEDKMMLVGVTGYEITVIRKITVIMLLDERQTQHNMYVIADDFLIDYEGRLLGVDSLRKHLVKCDYNDKLLKIRDSILKLYPYKIIRINSRCKT